MMGLVDGHLAKLLVSGPPGAGKTTAIAAISDIPPISTEVLATDELAFEKDETTVGMDYGQVMLEGGEMLAVYGTPGQPRFSFMWQILLEGAAGGILLLNHARPDPLADLSDFVPTFAPLFHAQRMVVGISRHDPESGPALEDYLSCLQNLGVDAPVLTVDVRERDDVLLLIESLELLQFDDHAHGVPG